jgi:hypothetical protein
MLMKVEVDVHYRHNNFENFKNWHMKTINQDIHKFQNEERLRGF